jgi:hypothetical protein
MLARDTGDTCWVDHMGFDAPLSQPSDQPETIPTGFVGDGDPIDGVAGSDRLVAQAVKQLKQRHLIGSKLLQRLAVDSRNHRGDQPSRLAHLDDSDNRAILIQSGERFAKVIRLWHEASSSAVSSDDNAWFSRSAL